MSRIGNEPILIKIKKTFLFQSFRITNKKLDVRKNGWHFTVNCDFNIDQVPKEAKGYMYEKK